MSAERLDDTWAEHFRRNQPVLDGLLMDMDAAGVPLLLGSDCFGGVVPGFGAHQELERMVAAGRLTRLRADMYGLRGVVLLCSGVWTHRSCTVMAGALVLSVRL